MVYEYSGYLKAILSAPDEAQRDQTDHIAFGPDDLAAHASGSALRKRRSSGERREESKRELGHANTILVGHENWPRCIY